MDAEEGREKKRVNLGDDPSNRAMVHLHLLPKEILLEILSRLPITSLIHFKTTSHASFDLITDPRLPPMFRNRVSDSNPCLILFRNDSAATRGVYFVGSEGCNRRVRRIDPPQYSELDNLVGSCNGLLCLSVPIIGGSSESHSLLIYNPFVGDAVRVQPEDQFLNQFEVFGFGFHPRTREFKVARIVSYDKIVTVANLNEFTTVNESMVQVFTVGTTEWRERGAPPEQFQYGSPQALVEGSLHWLMVVRMEEVSPIFGIISFELADEVFEEIPHPPCQQLVSRDYSLSVLNGCLSAAGLVDTVHFDIWVMKEYHVMESWVKQFSFDPYYPGGRPIFLRGFPKVICALKNGEILLQYNDSSLVSYDPVENRVKTLQISALSKQFQALPFLPSLLSAKATMNTEEEREKKRVKLAEDPSNRAMVQRDLHDLPLDVLHKILSRLPITSLIYFKTTSLAGYDLIAHPGLATMFRNRVSDSNPCLILFNHKLPGSWRRQLYFMDIEDCSRRIRKIDLPQHSNANDLVGSCNGLLCLSLIDGSSESHSLLIYNPFVGEAVRVPPANRFLNQIEVFGFGFHPRTGEFKVVRIVWFALDVEKVEELMVQVFTVGTTEWRTKGATPPLLADVIGPPEALVEGSLHWVTFVGIGGDGPIFGIISFELADEVFEEIPHPPCQQFVSRGYSLSVLNGCLSAVRLVETGHFDIWVMKQYHVEESWVKQFSFDPCFPGEWPSFLRRFPKVICALKNGEILLQNNDNSLVFHDPIENRFKTLQISGLPNWFEALPFLPSLFSARQP